MIEQNKDLHKYRDIKLYEHQKKIFTLCKTPGAKLYLYQAPTGTCKTLTPVGLVSPHNSDIARKKKTFKDIIMEYEINMDFPDFENSIRTVEIEKIKLNAEAKLTGTNGKVRIVVSNHPIDTVSELTAVFKRKIDGRKWAEKKFQLE